MVRGRKRSSFDDVGLVQYQKSLREKKEEKG